MKKLYDTRLIPLDILSQPNQQVVVKCIKKTLTRNVGYIALWEESWGHINKAFFQPQRLVVTSDEPVGWGWYIDDANLIRKSVTDDADYWAVRKHYKKVEATYPSMPEISMIDIADVLKWVKEGHSGCVELEVEDCSPKRLNCDTIMQCDSRGCQKPNPALTNNTVKMVWAEPFVDERQYLREDKEYNETGYREEDDDTKEVSDAVSQAMKNLLTPRCQVIADYFYSPYKIGDIIEPNERGTVHLTTTVQYDSFDGQNHDVVNYMPFETVKKYPHLFKTLNWWQQRAAEDMPEYLKDYIQGKIVVKVYQYLSDGFISDTNKQTGYASPLHIFVPATKEEYENFIKSKIIL